MRLATTEEIASLEMLAVELDRRRSPSVVPGERDAHVGLAERAVVGDQTLVLDEATAACLDVARLFGVALRPRGQADLEIGARQELTRR